MAVGTTSALVDERVEALVERVHREVDEGLLPGCSMAIGLNGEVVFTHSYGDLAEDDKVCIFSATKAFVVSSFWHLLGERLVAREDKVADYLPGFGDNGKQDITVEQVLLHTAGFPNAPMGPPEMLTHEGRLGVYPTWTLDWEPGTKYLYHHSSAHWVLADIIRVVTGIDHRDFLRQRVLGPLGIDGFVLGAPVGQQQDHVDVVYVGEEMTPDELEALLGIREIPAPEGSLQAMGEFGLLLNDPEAREAGIPAGGGFSTAAAVASFYQGLLHNPGTLWDPDVLDAGTQQILNTLPDALFQVPASRALGTIVAGDDGFAHMRGFGKTQSPRAFGHNGAGGQLAFADPASGLSFAYLTNGFDRHMLRQARRTVGIVSRAAVCAQPV